MRRGLATCVVLVPLALSLGDAATIEATVPCPAA